MLLSREEICQDKTFDLLTEAILERDQPRTTDLFFGMVARDGRSVGDALSVVTAAEAPFVQVPSHINVRDGQITLINNDHTILGLRAAVARVFEGGLWTPADIDLGGGADAETADLMARLASLTPQQVRVLMMLSEGLLNKQIAYELGVSEATIKAHVSAILQKLGVESRTQAVIAAAKIAGGQWRQETPSPQ